MDERTPETGQNTVTPHAPETVVDQTTREQLYTANLSSLRDAGYTAYPQMLHLDADRIMSKLASRLSRFICDSEADFLRLSEQYTRNVALHLERFYRLINDHHRLIYSAIQRSLNGEPVDDSTCIEDIVTEVSLRIFPMVNQLLRQGTAKLGTRVFALSRKHCYFYHVSPRRRQRNAVDKRMKTGRGFNGAECFSDQELDAMRAAEKAELATA